MPVKELNLLPATRADLRKDFVPYSCEFTTEDGRKGMAAHRKTTCWEWYDVQVGVHYMGTIDYRLVDNDEGSMADNLKKQIDLLLEKEANRGRFKIVGYPPDQPEKQWDHSINYYDIEKAQKRIDSGEVYKYLMEDLKTHVFKVVAY
jgi:hypothetical protein